MIIHKVILRFNLLNLLLFLFLSSINIHSQDHVDWSKNLAIYEVNIRQYTTEGTFDAFATHLERLKELGVGILWFMPIHPIGVENRLGTLGSYYSVKNYYDINPEFGNMQDFRDLVGQAHDMGFYVVIDWVANHTAWDNPLTETNPEWYTKDANGNFMAPAGTGWSDVIDLDYSQTGLRNYMIDAMKYWVTATGIDGFRFDAASMVPLDFWTSAITELKNTKPDLLMIAEAEGTEYQDTGFDATFAWKLYGFGSGVLPKIVDGSYNANFLASFLRLDVNDYEDDHYRIYFTSNHDENSWYGTVFERFGDAAEVLAAFTLTANGIPLVYSGQEAGLNKRLQFFEKDRITWRDYPFFDMYKTLLELKKENHAMWNGQNGGVPQRVLTDNNTDVFALQREKDNDKIFALFNLTDSPNTVTPTGELFPGKYVNVFSNDTVNLDSESKIELNAWGYQVYKQTNSLTSADQWENNPYNFRLAQNYPNPFNPATTIEYQIPSNISTLLGEAGDGLKSPTSRSDFSKVHLVVYDILGREVATLVDKKQKPGVYKIEFDGSNLASGMYFYKLTAGLFTTTKKMLLVK